MAKKRLIDANALMEQFDDCNFKGFVMKRLIEMQPTVDAVEVVHGRWEWLGPYRYNNDGMIGTCSVCKERLRLFATNYCPNCGAKMDGEIRTSVQ